MENRRAFLGKVGAGVAWLRLAPVLGLSILTAGCGFWSDVATWGNIGLDAFNSIVTLLETSNIPFTAAAVMIIRAGFAQLIADAQQIDNLNPKPVGATATILADLQIILNNFQAFLSNIQVSGGLLSLIAAAATIIIDAIMGFINQAPTTTTKVTLNGPVMLSARRLEIAPKYYSHTGAFKKDWNRIWKAAGHPEGEMRLSVGEWIY